MRQDVRDISRIELVDQLDLFVRLLPARVTAPLSQRSIAEDCEISPVAIKSWIRVLQLLYFGFSLPPFAQRIERAVKREKKWYFMQWTFNEEGGALFENYLAVQLAGACQFWRDQGHGKFELFYLRDQSRREVDFVIEKNMQPLALIEAKMSPLPWPAALRYYTEKLQIPGFLVYPDGPVRRQGKSGWSMPCRMFLKNLIAA